MITNASSSSKGGKVSHECICGKTFAAAMQLAGHKGRCDVYAQAKHGAPYARNEIDRSKRLAKVSVPNGMNLVPVEPLSQGLMQLKNTTASDQELRSGNDTNNFDNQEGDMGESRNNLYWNHKLCEACLWYGQVTAIISKLGARTSLSKEQTLCHSMEYFARSIKMSITEHFA